MNGKNAYTKYGITREQFKEGIDIVSKNLGKICNVNVLLAVTEVLANGDIEVPEKPQQPKTGVTVGDLLAVFDKDSSVDVYDNYTEELGIAYCGNKLTPEGEAHFAEALTLPVTEIRNDVVIVGVDAPGQAEQETEHKLQIAKDFFESMAGQCSATDYDKCSGRSEHDTLQG